MKLIYDPRFNIAYLKLQEKTPQVQTIKVSDDVNVDVSPDGTIYGIELLNAKQQLQDLAVGTPSIEFFESILETVDIMGNSNMMAALRRGIKDIQEGKLIPLEEVKSTLGIE